MFLLVSPLCLDIAYQSFLFLTRTLTYTLSCFMYLSIFINTVALSCFLFYTCFFSVLNLLLLVLTRGVNVIHLFLRLSSFPFLSCDVGLMSKGPTILLHPPLYSAALWDSAELSPVLSLKLSSFLFLCHPLLRPLLAARCKSMLVQSTWIHGNFLSPIVLIWPTYPSLF